MWHAVCAATFCNDDKHKSILHNKQANLPHISHIKWNNRSLNSTGEDH